MRATDKKNIASKTFIRSKIKKIIAVAAKKIEMGTTSTDDFDCQIIFLMSVKPFFNKLPIGAKLLTNKERERETVNHINGQ